MNSPTERRRIWKHQTGTVVAATPSFHFADAPYRVVLNCACPGESDVNDDIKRRSNPAHSLTVNPTEEVTS